jgi:uncharacterized protein (TIGR00299 family) protein
MKVAYFDCFSGASGDMLLGALVDAGLEPEILRSTLRKVALSGYRLVFRKVLRGPIAATRAEVKLEVTPLGDEPRRLSTIRTLLEESTLPAKVVEKAGMIFQRLAEAEARIHGVEPEKIHFHETGAVDSIVDVVGAVSGLHLLGVEKILCSRFRIGRGEVHCQHGLLPVPAPATLELLRGLPLQSVDMDHELTTPTGAAILSTLCEDFGPPPDMTLSSVGYGAGMTEHADRPNVLRLLIGSAAAPSGKTGCWVVETTLDDATPEILGHLFERLLDAGALDVLATPGTMKKSRPAVMLTVLTRWEDLMRVESLIFQETPTFGVRRYPVERTILERESLSVATPYGPIRVKVGRYRGTIVTASPEYEDCRRAALERSLPLRVVYRAAEAASSDRFGPWETPTPQGP